MSKEINSIPLKDAENNEERKLLGILSQQSKDIQYGKLTLDITIQAGKIVGLSIEKIKTNIKI